MSSIIGHGFTPKQLFRAKQTLVRAWEWRIANPLAWARVVSHALDLARQGQPIAAQALIESVRKKAFVDAYGQDMRINNSFAPIIARWLALEHPETAPHIERRRSVFDVIGVRHV